MPYTTTHVLIAIILIELYREYFLKDNKQFPRYYILIMAIGAIIPDLDVILYAFLYPLGFSLEQLHRTFLHSVFVPFAFFLIGILIYSTKIKNADLRKRHMKLYSIFFILGAGALIHLILDYLLAGQIIPFYPFSNLEVGLNIIDLFPTYLHNLIYPALDTILLFFWLFWMEFKLKINDYF